VKKGIILAGGAGTRLYPLSLVASKQLQPIYDKPMVYYPLTTLMLAGIHQVCLISTPQDLPRFKALLGDGSQWGLQICYKEQAAPKGIAKAFLIAEEFIAGDPVTLILGDNIFYGRYEFCDIFPKFKTGGHIFAYRVKDPHRYGVVEFDLQGKAISKEEKPAQPKSNYAVPGLYLYDQDVVDVCKKLKPSARGELEITDVNLEYMRRGQLCVSIMSRGKAWLDTGTSSSLQEASGFIQTIESRQGSKVGCPEEVALRKGFITLAQFEALTQKIPNCEYNDYLKEILCEFRERQYGD
jgi:glucose-1-phosphate thymidylyltransferase